MAHNNDSRRYLAFIGFFCFEAGLKMMTGVDEITGLFKRATINGTHHPEIHAQNMDNLILLAPGVTLGAVLLLVLQRFRHFAVLPCMLISIPTIYYIVMFATGLSFEEARAAHGYGWLANATVEDGSNVTTADDFWDGWKDYKFAQIHWHALPRQLPTWLAMYFVVAFSSSLDVAAIQMELGKPLDFNHELKTVGISNIASGLTGGFTGSYIFSQTIFTMRAGIRTRWIGAVLSTFMAIAFTIPISILAFVPRFFFGAILSLIAYDLFLEWLWHSRHLMAPIEYVCGSSMTRPLHFLLTRGTLDGGEPTPPLRRVSLRRGCRKYPLEPAASYLCYFMLTCGCAFRCLIPFLEGT